MARKSSTKKSKKASWYNYNSDPAHYRAKKNNTRKNKSAGKRRSLIEGIPEGVVSLGERGISTGIGVTEVIGEVGMKVGKTAVKDVGNIGMKVGKDIGSVGMTGVKDVGNLGMTGVKDVGKLGKRSMKMLTGKKKKKKKSKKGKKGKKGSYRAFLSKRLKEVKRSHPDWPQSKVFKEAVKGWNASK